jgi:hypothetical protein
MLRKLGTGKIQPKAEIVCLASDVRFRISFSTELHSLIPTAISISINKQRSDLVHYAPSHEYVHITHTHRLLGALVIMKTMFVCVWCRWFI